MPVAARKLPSVSIAGLATFGAVVALIIVGLAMTYNNSVKARALVESARAAEIATESKSFCDKYVSSPDRTANCISEIQVIRNNESRRVMADAEGIL